MAASGIELVRLAATRIGDRYVFGSFAPKDNPMFHGPWDCAEFASWLVYQVTGWLYGCDNNAGRPATQDAWTEHWRRDAGIMGRVVSIDVAAGTPGAFLLRHKAGDYCGHVALSDGKGGTVEARGSHFGVCAARADFRPWDIGICVPHVEYEQAAPTHVLPPEEKILHHGDTGPDVRELQEALAERGISPGKVDALLGPHTVAAVRSFQAVAGLVVDGRVGAETRKALGLGLGKHVAEGGVSAEPSQTTH